MGTKQNGYLKIKDLKKNLCDFFVKESIEGICPK